MLVVGVAAEEWNVVAVVVVVASILVLLTVSYSWRQLEVIRSGLGLEELERGVLVAVGLHASHVAFLRRGRLVHLDEALRERGALRVSLE